jgi:hypothetical protein
VSQASRASRRLRRLLLGVALLACAALALALAPFGRTTGAGVSRAAGPSGGEPVPQTDDSVPAREVTMIGATPAEAGGGRNETWGLGRGAAGALLVRYTADTGWSLGPGLQDEAGHPLAGFVLDTPESFTSTSTPSPLAGQMTAHGSGVLAGSVEGKQVLLVRDPNSPANPFRQTEAVPTEDLGKGERLFGLSRAPLLAPLEESGGHGGTLVVPVREHGSGIEEHVLHWNGDTHEWTREPIELPSGSSETEFRVLGIGASSPGNAWLLAQLSAGNVALFHRRLGSGGEPPSWHAVAFKSGGKPGEPLTIGEGAHTEALTVPGAHKERTRIQVLTVTSQGVWIDAERPEVRGTATLFYKPEGEGHGSLTSWCTAENPGPGSPECDHPLPEALPSGPSRSIAWASGSAPFGDRVITGLPNGVSLRLDGTTFTRVLSLGGSEEKEPGAQYGAAFSGPREGWLGKDQLPVHLTPEAEASPNRLSPWPVSFRHALVAVAPQPGASIGALSSQALAVGDLGEVARYLPGLGWVPESLFGAGGRRKTPRLRAVAWPTPTRAYAVGDAGQGAESAVPRMWMWRGETGLWEPDPAEPYNFRGNLLGIAFDPNDPARGYAVGESGVLLSYGKSWAQEPASNLPPGLAGASFTSIAFAGSEAIVAYRILPDPSTNRYIGGIIVNDGSGWRVDTGAAAAMGSNVPWAVAGLPDGGAAFAGSGNVYEREAAGAPWQVIPTPFPGGGEPGSVALFREGGALRAIAAGSAPDTFSVESASQAPPGFPPALIAPYPLGTNVERGLLRQTATGWSDEEHNLNNVKGPAGNWSGYDIVFQPDPISAVLIDPSGSQGWAVGGLVEPPGQEHAGGVLSTSDISRYPADGSVPPGVTASPITTDSGQATFAIGGNAACAAPCADRARAGIGPDVWLAGALERAHAPGVRAFFYTGPRVVDPHAISGPKEAADNFSYANELGRYASILAASPLPAFAAGTPTDLDEGGSEASFREAFKGFAAPFGAGAAASGLTPVGARPAECGAGCTSAYYAFESAGSGGAGAVRVIVLDDSSGVSEQQRGWLEGQLAGAAAKGQPAIVIGNADLGAEARANRTGAAPVVAALVKEVGGASAYFYDSPEQNVKKPLSLPSGGPAIPSFGSGTLGYVSYTAESSGAFLGAAGFLLAKVDATARDPRTNRAPVTVSLIPNIGELALEAKDGTLLRRSQAALFAGLARRQRAGNRSVVGRGAVVPNTDLYVPIPANCVGVACETELIEPEYTFKSSDLEYGKFVKPNLASPDPRAVELNASGEPIPDEHSGLFCALNKGTTTVTITAGGLSASLPVTVQAGSVRRPCGTTKLLEKPQRETTAIETPLVRSQPTEPAPASIPLPLPAPLTVPPAAPAPPARPPVAPPASFFVPQVALSPLLAALPPPLPTPARPTPPSGTSPVTQPVEAPEKEEEEEEATESVGNQAVAYRAPEHEPSSGYILGVVLLAAFAGASIRRRPRRGGRGAQIAPATISTLRSQRRMEDRDRRRY